MVSPEPQSDNPDPSRTAPTTTSSMHYRNEERRPVYFMTAVPPSHVLDLGGTASGHSSTDMGIRLMPDRRPVVLYRGNEPKPAADSVEVPRRSSMHHHSKADMAVLRMSNVTPVPAGRDSPLTPTHARVLFYHKTDPHYGFTSFSPHPVYYNNKRYPTSEHLFQSFKFQPHRPGLAEHIRTCSERPSVAFSEARRFQPEMDQALWCKFMQHKSLKNELLATDDAELVEDSDKDAFWGVGADRRGRNELGKALERLRTKLRSKPSFKPDN
ncbi:DUF1768 domain-containing protein [Mycena sanguinolenta]|uniref:DUF1768 domain-containing protein n=1 Tax=Mycena sanguinolenta TaxID=230812 RepID=A0A8H6YDW7_9AGAR|nr:DUF1768 domain-containing protein [Mycena sanguinolenta]